MEQAKSVHDAYYAALSSRWGDHPAYGDVTQRGYSSDNAQERCFTRQAVQSRIGPPAEMERIDDFEEAMAYLTAVYANVELYEDGQSIFEVRKKICFTYKMY